MRQVAYSEEFKRINWMIVHTWFFANYMYDNPFRFYRDDHLDLKSYYNMNGNTNSYMRKFQKSRW